MSATSSTLDLQAAVVELLNAPGALRIQIPVLVRKRNELGSQIAASVANHNLCILVSEPLPTKAMQDVPFVFFEEAEVRISIVEKPSVNQTSADAFDLIDDVATALHWQPKETGTNLGRILAHPLQLAPRPVERKEDANTRSYDLLFTATFQLNPLSEEEP